MLWTDKISSTYVLDRLDTIEVSILKFGFTQATRPLCINESLNLTNIGVIRLDLRGSLMPSLSLRKCLKSHDLANRRIINRTMAA
jgi:hypothetical protein